MLPSANLRGPPDKYGLLTLARPSVRCCSTLQAWSPLFHSTLRVSQVAKAMMAARGDRAYILHFFRMLWYDSCLVGDAELFSPSMIGCLSKYFFSKLSTTGHLFGIFYI